MRRKRVKNEFFLQPRWDHPRACGENASLSPIRVSRLGSPPRMRGKRQIRPDGTKIGGITPAHAGKTGQRRRRGYRLWDHPRACGENKAFGSVKPKSRGSPPRMRGKRVFEFVLCDGQGITPAHAGKTADALRSRRRTRDHPRACGENPLKSVRSFSKAGSPPRMRGKPVSSVPKNHVKGITPAHAGKTQVRFLLRSSFRDHPRACGENKK